jgi:signal transduction histidine kinase/ActR/RegA family two-component response regulator
LIFATGRILGLIAFVALPTIGTALVTGWLALKEYRFHDREELGVAAQSVATAIDVKLEGFKAAAVALANSDELVGGEGPSAMDAEARRVAEAIGGWFVVSTSDEPIRQLLNTAQPKRAAFVSPGSMADYPEISVALELSVKTGRPQVSDVFLGPAVKRPVVAVVTPIRPVDGQNAFLSFAVEPIQLSNILLDHPSKPGEQLMVVDGSGRIIARSLDPDPYLLQPLPEWALAAIGDRSEGVFEGESPDSNEVSVFAFQRLGSAPRWIAITVAPRSGPMEDVIHSGWPALVTLAVLLVSMALFALVIRHNERVEDLARSQAELSERRALLEESRDADRKKSNMIAVLSHEMRAPLVSLLGAMDLLRAEGLSRVQREHVDLASRDGEILLRLIDDVLELARLGAGQLRLEPVDFDPAEVVRDVAAIVGPEAQRKSIVVTASLTPGLARVVGDAHRIRQVLLNFATNALKFTHAGRIDVSVTAHGPTDAGVPIEFAVTDTGIGIAAGDLSRLFTDFGMLDSTRPESRTGVGLGLAISRRLVQAMGGETGVTSREGEGSRFWFRLTLPQARSAGHAAGPVVDVPADNSLKGLRVLVAEDQELVRLLTKRRLEAAGAQVETAVDGMQAVLIAERMPVDLILMDLMMPKLDGATAAQRIRSGRGPSADARIVGLTAHQQPESTLILSRLAMDACLEKPLDFKALLALLTIDGPIPDRKPTVAGDAEAILDPAAVAALRAAAPPRFVGAAFERFAEEVEARAQEIVAADADLKLDSVRQTAHKLAGLCLTMGAQSLASRLRTIAAAARSGEQHRVHEAMVGFEIVAETTRKAALAAAAEFEPG